MRVAVGAVVVDVAKTLYSVSLNLGHMLHSISYQSPPIFLLDWWRQAKHLLDLLIDTSASAYDHSKDANAGEEGAHPGYDACLYSR